MSLSAWLGLERILRRTRQFFSSALTPLARPAAAGVRGVHVLLVLRQLPEPAGVGVLASTPLRDRHRRPGALVGGVGRGADRMVGERVDDAVGAGRPHVVAG
ncbi:hypothetical protein, partial [Saccharomonospora iraqiensis]|uniref:hypothetical protein n=1 Tax=Saccharomonospora iraqiensis TaxID=52698 RepID=UPI00059327BF